MLQCWIHLQYLGPKGNHNLSFLASSREQKEQMRWHQAIAFGCCKKDWEKKVEGDHMEAGVIFTSLFYLWLTSHSQNRLGRGLDCWVASICCFQEVCAFQLSRRVSFLQDSTHYQNKSKVSQNQCRHTNIIYMWKSYLIVIHYSFIPNYEYLWHKLFWVLINDNSLKHWNNLRLRLPWPESETLYWSPRGNCLRFSCAFQKS